MIIHKKPEKIILDLLYTPDSEMIFEQISRAGLSCLCIERSIDKGNEDTQNIDTENCFQNNTPIGVQLSAKDCQNALIITDSAQKAWEYKNQNLAVLVYLHEGNKDQIFTKNRYFIEGFEDADATYFTRIYQREKNIPWMIGETERLVIREMTPVDTDALYQLYADKSVVEFMEDLPTNKDEEKEYIADYIDKVYSFFGFGMWLVQLKETGEIIGRVGFQNYEEEDLVELGFMIVPKHQHKGYAYEACEAAIAYMREEFPEYQRMARCKAENTRAIGLCRRLGIECRVVDKQCIK
ncbi:MAG: GNAT family N-acetyltransferase [Lachnospiraceae bacterium]|nr:GNAT family N-acetyltransferase [Lachnospiraceae bacterium]